MVRSSKSPQVGTRSKHYLGRECHSPIKEEKGNEMKNAMVFMALALSLAACAAPSTPTTGPVGTRTPLSLPTLGPILSPTPTPSSIPRPAQSPTLIPSITPTLPLSLTSVFAFLTPSITPTPSRELDCKLLTQSIANGTLFRPGEPFSMGWNISNTGTAGWNPGNVDFVYYGGTRMVQVQLVHLPKSVGSGDSVSLAVDMKAPNKISQFTTVWSLRRGTEYFCRVRLTIAVR